MEKPAGPRREALWLEIHDAALILEAARQLRPLGGTTLDAEAIARLRADWAAGECPSKRAAGRAYGGSDVIVGRILRGSNALQRSFEITCDQRYARRCLATYAQLVPATATGLRRFFSVPSPSWPLLYPQQKAWLSVVTPHV